MNGEPHAGTEWDARAYHRISDPQVAWGEKVLDRLALHGDETVLDAGCGSGRLTAMLLERLPRGRVLALDISTSMLAAARAHLEPRFAARVTFVHADAQRLALDTPVDAIFSTATFHWVPDHPLLFRHLFQALRPGGRLVAQCGGGPNLAHLLRRVSALASTTPYAPYFAGWPGPWEFADAATTARRLRAAGFERVETSVEAAPTRLDGAEEYREFLAEVILRLHLPRLPDEARRARFLESLVHQAAQDNPPWLLDYWRLNLQGQRP